jgi:carbon storage regulator
MLVLTRKAGEAVLVGDSIRVTVERIDGGAVRLGFTAPKSIPVLREEVMGRQREDRDGSD